MTRTDPPATGTEAEQLRAYLDYHRETLRQKTDGLTADQLAATHAPSTMTLGGLLKHLAYVEAYWLDYVLAGHEPGPPWDTAPWDDDADWDWHSADQDTPAELRDLFDRTVTASDELIEAAGDLEALAVREVGGKRFNLRWLLLHLVEEYARHNGHADLLREAVDGTTGE